MSEFFHLSEDDLARAGAAAGISEKHLAGLSMMFADQRASKEAVTDKDKYIGILLETPGVDPVLAVADDHAEDIPSKGWLLRANVSPGFGGVIRISKYGEGSFEVTSTSDTREKYGNVRVSYTLGPEYGEHTVAYENPAYPNKATQPCERTGQSSYTGMSWASTEIVDLPNGGRILDQEDPLQVRNGGVFFTSMNWNDYGEGTTKRQYSPGVEVNRVATGHEEIGGMIVNLGFGMGLEQEDIRVLLETVASKIANA